MGCDIHVYVEVKNDITGKWGGIMVPNPYYSHEDGTAIYLSPYNGRDYLLFGILAGVRSDFYDTIDCPRGLPSDVSDDVVAEYNREQEWVYSASYLTLDELETWGADKKNFTAEVDCLDETATKAA